MDSKKYVGGKGRPYFEENSTKASLKEAVANGDSS